VAKIKGNKAMNEECSKNESVRGRGILSRLVKSNNPAVSIARLLGNEKRYGAVLTAVLQDSNLLQSALLRLENRNIPAKVLNRFENTIKRDLQKQHGFVRGNYRNQEDVLVEIGKGCELFESPEGEAFATLLRDELRETWPVRSDGFRGWLKKRFADRTGKFPCPNALNNALGQLADIAMASQVEHPVFVRVGHHGGHQFLDLGDETWEAIEITPTGWTVTPNPPVRFMRSKGIRPLLRPDKDGDIGQLRKYLNLQAESDWILVVSWLFGALFSSGPYPILILLGERGSAKSEMSKLLRMLIDPAEPCLRSFTADLHSLMISARNNHLIVFDNLSSLKRSDSDILCRLATGGGWTTRSLRRDIDETTFNVQRPAILNGITEFATQPDLQDRALTIRLHRIPDDKRRTVREIEEEFQKDLPRILGGLLNAISVALKNRGQLQLTSRPRMADFAELVAAAEAALPWKAGEFLAAYRKNLKESAETVLATNLIALAIDRHLRLEGTLQGTATGLMEALGGHLSDSELRTRDWPKSPEGFARRLQEITPLLRDTGVAVDRWREGKSGDRLIRIGYRKTEQADSSDGSDSKIRALTKEAPNNSGVAKKKPGVAGKVVPITSSLQLELLRERMRKLREAR